MKPVNNAADMRANLLDKIARNRGGVSSYPCPSDDYVWRDPDGSPIYSVVARTNGEVGSTKYETKSLFDAVRYLSREAQYDVDPEIRSGGVTLLSRDDIEAISQNKPVMKRAVPFEYLVKIMNQDEVRFQSASPRIDVRGFGAPLDPVLNSDEDEFFINKIPVSKAAHSILQSAAMRSLPDHVMRRLEDFATFTQLSGGAATPEDVDKAWKRTVRSKPDEAELQAAWEARKAEMRDQAVQAVKSVAGAARKAAGMVKSLVSGSWAILRQESMQDGGPDEQTVVTAYASAFLDASRAWKGDKQELDGYQNEYVRGHTLGEHLVFGRDSLSKNVADTLIPVHDGVSEKPTAYQTVCKLPAEALLDAMSAVSERGGGTLINGKTAINVLDAIENTKAVSELNKSDVSPDAARKAGQALYGMMQIAGRGSEVEVYKKMAINPGIMENAAIRQNVMEGFEDAARSGPRNGPRVSTLVSLMMAAREATPVSEPEAKASSVPEPEHEVPQEPQVASNAVPDAEKEKPATQPPPLTIAGLMGIQGGADTGQDDETDEDLPEPPEIDDDDDDMDLGGPEL